ncbi:MBOAT family protein [uncultured Holdemanella sp.]|uniref:MBOAT family O-acyltransferase n=1 Tax=uncultured Holdemanella sp. TaxID=1763549 RepID=UPI0025F74501|nr:MBOAT family O-acyltransferase [uncultured Holdemanella sp.]
MVFNSLIFIFMFLPIVYLAYTFIPTWTCKCSLLIICSLLFYSWGQPASLVLMLVTILWDYFTGIELTLYEGKKRRAIFWIGVLFHVLILMIYKYFNFIFGFTSIHVQLALPVGLSFFTFSAISYLADVYLGKSQAQNNILSLALYLSFFGKVSMGPIVQYHDMEAYLTKQHKISVIQFGEAFQKIMKGLAKKVIIADQLSLMYSTLSTNSTWLGTWLCAIAYMLQIYFDFSGYSDMAIGISRLFGFEFDENFDHPYIADSVQNFWRRWHISLSRWFRDYIYIPLGGNRVSNQLYIRNILVVWLLTGIWHGASLNFIVWGLYYGLLLLAERFVWKDKLSHLPKFIQHLYTLFLVLIGWVFFMSPSLGSAFKTIFAMFGLGVKGIWDNQALFSLRQNLILIVLASLFSMPIFDVLQKRFVYILKQKSIILSVCFWFILFLISIAFIVGNTFQSFLYFAF